MFLNCEKLRYIELPATIWHIGEEAFYGCPNLTVKYNDYAKYFRAIDFEGHIDPLRSAVDKGTQIKCLDEIITV